MDELRIILTPILLGGGKTVFDGMKKRYPLRLLSTKKFKSGNVVAIYEPALR
jgi:dihydrofolate reductase